MRLLLTTLTVLPSLLLPFVGLATWKVYTTTYAKEPVQLVVSLAFLFIQFSLDWAAVVFINTLDARVWFRAMTEGSSGAAYLRVRAGRGAERGPSACAVGRSTRALGILSHHL